MVGGGSAERPRSGLRDDETGRWVRASRAARGDRPLDAAQVASWREQGFVMVSGLFPETLVEALSAEAIGRFPAPESDAARSVSNFGSELHFSSTITALNELTADFGKLR